MEMVQQREAEQQTLMTVATDSDAASISVSTSMPAVVPEDSQQGLNEDMEVESVGVSKPQQAREDCPMVENERPLQQLTGEQFSGKLEILLKEDDGSEVEVKPACDREEGKPWFEINAINIEHMRIEIHELQLRKPSCKVNSGSQTDGSLRGYLYGQMYKKGGKYIAEFEFYMHFCRTVRNLQEQIEVSDAL